MATAAGGTATTLGGSPVSRLLHPACSVAGSWNNWERPVKMHCAGPGQPHRAIVNMPYGGVEVGRGAPGCRIRERDLLQGSPHPLETRVLHQTCYLQYKYKVDGTWRVSVKEASVSNNEVRCWESIWDGLAVLKRKGARINVLVVQQRRGRAGNPGHVGGQAWRQFGMCAHTWQVRNPAAPTWPLVACALAVCTHALGVSCRVWPHAHSQCVACHCRAS